MDLDFRFPHKSIVRIALELLWRIFVRSILIRLYFTLSCSVSSPFDAIVYDSTMPMETVVSSSFKSWEDRAPAFSAKNVKNLQKSEKTLNLNEMSTKQTFNLGQDAKSTSAVQNANEISLKLSFKCVLDFRFPH